MRMIEVLQLGIPRLSVFGFQDNRKHLEHLNVANVQSVAFDILLRFNSLLLILKFISRIAYFLSEKTKSNTYVLPPN